MSTLRATYGFLWGMIGTTFLLQWWQLSSYPKELWIMIVVLIILGSLSIIFKRSRLVGTIMITSILGMSLALFSVSRTVRNLEAATITPYATNHKVTLTGTIDGPADKRMNKIQYALEVSSLQIGTGSKIPVTGTVLLVDRNRWPVFQAGDTVEAKGILQLPQNSDDFSYQSYLKRFGITAILERGSIIMKQEGSPSILRTLATWRDALEQRMNRLLPEPESALLAGLLTGSRQGLSDDVSDAFRRTGLTHILAISGSNITIILSVIMGLLFFLPLRWRLVPAAFAIIAFTLFTGASASAVRACIMGLLGLSALQAHRLRHTRLAVLWTAFFMLLYNPLQLWSDASFQLSFLAVIGLTEVGPILKPRMQWIPETLGLRDALLATVCAQIAALPWIVYAFHELSLISIFANMIIVPLIPLAMLLGTITVILGSIPLIGHISVVASWAVLWMIITITTLFGSLPFASVSIGRFDGWVLVVIYALLGFILWRLHRRPTGRRRQK